MNARQRVGQIAVFLSAFAFGLCVVRAADNDTPSSDLTPRHILIIRHGEKSGEETDVHLNSRGAARAAALPSLFVIPPAFPTKPAPFPTPDFLYATKESKRSNRPVETIMPLAAALKDMKIHHKHKDEDYQAVVDAIFGNDKHAGKTVLICWHHGTMPELGSAIAAKAANSAKLKAQIP